MPLTKIIFRQFGLSPVSASSIFIALGVNHGPKQRHNSVPSISLWKMFILLTLLSNPWTPMSFVVGNTYSQNFATSESIYTFLVDCRPAVKPPKIGSRHDHLFNFPTPIKMKYLLYLHIAVIWGAGQHQVMKTPLYLNSMFAFGRFDSVFLFRTRDLNSNAGLRMLHLSRSNDRPAL